MFSPDHAWLIERLATLNPEARNHPDKVADHALEIYGRWLDYRSRNDTKKYTIREGCAVLVEATRGGIANELAQLARTKGKTAKQRRRALLSTSGAARDLTYASLLNLPPFVTGPDGKRRRGDLDLNANDLETYRVPGLHILLPLHPHPLAEAALARQAATPATERRVRKADASPMLSLAPSWPPIAI